MVMDAMECAGKMRRWRDKNDGKWRNKVSSPPPDAFPAKLAEEPALKPEEK
jgi:2-methylcitrate dehydratase PrpD